MKIINGSLHEILRVHACFMFALEIVFWGSRAGADSKGVNVGNYP